MKTAKMELFTKLIIFSVLVLACGRSIELENLFNITRDQIDISEIECDCNWRYFKHYEIKDCILEKVDSCGCPKIFSCPQNQTSLSPSKACVYRNKEYIVGSKITTTNACQRCKCRNGTPPFVSCIHTECPEVELGQGKDCHFVYEENRCCPVAHECSTVESEDESTINTTCEYNGKIYPFGSKIYSVDDDPCKICICDENWNSVDNSSCYQHDCVLEQSKSKLDAGCIPVYHESRCCPIEFYCPSSHTFNYSLLSKNESEVNETTIDNQCTFGSKYYNIGDQLFMDNPCVMCQCLVPPDFSCIHQTCPPSPNNENCFPVHSKEECCPSYECMYGDAEPETEGCPTPLCADASCRIETPPGHECPTCVCGERVSELEHNEIQQQVQQISQGVESDQQVNEGPIQTDSEDYSEDELQMMPIRMQDAEGQFTVMERIMLPESEIVEQYPSKEDSRELEESSSENNSSAETVFLPQQQEQIFGQIPENEEGIEREGETLESNDEFEDELERFKNKIFDVNGTIINEIISINHEVEVPAGCPTPLCEGPWCKVGIPPGHKCPTCICKRRAGNEP